MANLKIARRKPNLVLNATCETCIAGQDWITCIGIHVNPWSLWSKTTTIGSLLHRFWWTDLMKTGTRKSSLHNYLWTVLSTSCCNSRSWPIWTTTPRPGSKTTRYLQNMIWEVQSLSAALETWNPGLWLHSGMWSGLWAGWWRPGEGEPGEIPATNLTRAVLRWLSGDF